MTILEPKRSESLKNAQQRYRQRHRIIINDRQKLWYSQNKELFDSYRKTNKPPILNPKLEPKLVLHETITYH